MTRKQINELCESLIKEVENHSVYVWGGQGEVLYALELRKLSQMESNKKNFKRVVKLVSNRILADIDMSRAKCFDCSGLITYYLIKMGLLKYDTTADGIWKKCKEKDIADIRKGDFVFVVSDGRAVHIGCVVDDNMTIVEAYGRDKGVVMNELGKGSSQFNRAGTFNG